MPVALSNLRSVVAQVTRGGGRSAIVSRLRNLWSTSRGGKSYDSGSIVESGFAYYKAILPSSMAGLASFAWDVIQTSESEVKKRDVEKLNGLESKTPQHNDVLREAWRSLIHR